MSSGKITPHFALVACKLLKRCKNLRLTFRQTHKSTRFLTLLSSIVVVSEGADPCSDQKGLLMNIQMRQLAVPPAGAWVDTYKTHAIIEG